MQIIIERPENKASLAFELLELAELLELQGISGTTQRIYVQTQSAYDPIKKLVQETLLQVKWPSMRYSILDSSPGEEKLSPSNILAYLIHEQARRIPIHSGRVDSVPAKKE